MAVLTPDLVTAKLRELNGNMAAVGRAFGVTRGAVWKFVQARVTLREVVTDCRESMKDHAESALQTAVLRGEAWAVCFFLKCQAKDRGYVEKTEVDLGPEVTYRIRKVIVDGASRSGSNGAAARGAGGVLPE